MSYCQVLCDMICRDVYCCYLVSGKGINMCPEANRFLGFVLKQLVLRKEKKDILGCFIISVWLILWAFSKLTNGFRVGIGIRQPN